MVRVFGVVAGWGFGGVGYGLGDAELVRAAQAGDAEGLAVLLERDRARMLAVALGVLGRRPEVEDAVQEACLAVVRRIGELREPAAWRGWSAAIVRNSARAYLRSRSADVGAVPPVSEGLDPARVLERHAMGDWLWHAISVLSPEHRLVTMLRYFTDVTAYSQIAAICGVPVGTVRSRLNHARARLLEALAATADLAHGDQRALTRVRRREAAHALEEGRAGRYAEAMAMFCHPTVETIWAKGKRTYGFGYPAEAMRRDVGDGVVFRLAGVVAGPDVVIWETDLISPPEDPFHCPPDAVWVHTIRDGRSARIRIFHPRAAAWPGSQARS